MNRSVIQDPATDAILCDRGPLFQAIRPGAFDRDSKGSVGGLPHFGVERALVLFGEAANRNALGVPTTRVMSSAHIRTL